MYVNEASIFMFKYKQCLLPSSFKNFFTIHSANLTYNTRNKGDFQIPIHRIRTISSTGPKIWNDLPNNVKNANSLGRFKNKIKATLLKTSQVCII